MTSLNPSPLADTKSFGFLEAMWAQLDDLVVGRPRKRFERFLTQRGVAKWIIAADFCIDDSSRPNDTFAFVVFPAEKLLEDTLERLGRIPKRDLKEVKAPSSKLLRLISKGKVFSFCFIANKDRRLYPNADAARLSLDNTIRLMESWENADQCRATIDHVKAMRVEAQKKTLSLKLLTNIVTCAALIAFIAALISKHHKTELIGWVPDRDKMTEAYSSAVTVLFNANYAALSQKMDFAQANLGIFTQKPTESWCDPYIRIADFLAGATAAWNLPAKTVASAKVIPILSSLADNRYLLAFRMDFRHSGDLVNADMKRVEISHRKFKK